MCKISFKLCVSYKLISETVVHLHLIKYVIVEGVNMVVKRKLPVNAKIGSGLKTTTV